MFDQMMQIFKKSISKEQIAELLNTTPEALAEFEKAYNAVSDKEKQASGNFFKLNSRDVAQYETIASCDVTALEDRIVNELLVASNLLPCNDAPLVTNEDIKNLPEELRPQLTGHLVQKDVNGDSYPMLIHDLLSFSMTLNG